MSRSSSSGRRLTCLLLLIIISVLFTSVRSFNFLRISRAGQGVFGSRGNTGGRRSGEAGGRQIGGGSSSPWWRRPPLDEEHNLISTRFRLETDELLPLTITEVPISAAATRHCNPVLLPGQSPEDMMMMETLLSTQGSSSIIDSSSGFFHMPSDFGLFGEDMPEGAANDRRRSRRSLSQVDSSSSLSSEDLLSNHVLSSLMEPGPAPPKPEFDRNNNFTLNLGKALDALRVDVPLCFEREPDMSIYTEDVRFRDESRIYSNGKFMYQMFLFSLRLARVFMPIPPMVQVLNMRWCPIRQCIYVKFQIRIDALNDQLYYDATSVYRVNAQGMIYEHLIENVIRNDLMKPSIVSLYMSTKQILVSGSPPPVPDSLGL